MVPEIIDLSSNNGEVNFLKLKAAGVEHVFLRSSMGVGCKDKNLSSYAQLAEMAGLLVSYYHFSYPDLKAGGTTASDSLAEADYFCDTIQSLPKFEYIAIDCERFNAVSDTPLTPQQYYDWLTNFIDHVYARTGSRCLIYGTADYLNHRLPDGHNIGTKCQLWVANYNNISTPPVPKGWSSWFMWQYSEIGVVDGVSGKVDCSMFSRR